MDDEAAGEPMDNIVTFDVGRGEPVTALMDPEVADAVSQAWRQVSAEHGLVADQVASVGVIWLGDLDSQFVRATFPEAELMGIFARPEPDGWAEAFTQARTLFAAASEVQAKEEFEQKAAELETSMADGTLANGRFMPVLRSESVPGGEDVRARMPHFFVIPGKIYATFANITRTPNGNTTMLHLLYNNIKDLDDLKQRLAAGMESLGEGLRAEVRGSDDGQELIVISRSDGLPATSALCLDDFHGWVSGLRGWTDLAVQIMCPDHVYVMPADAPYVSELRRAVLEADEHHLRNHPELLPSLLHVTANTMELIAERPAGSNE